MGTCKIWCMYHLQFFILHLEAAGIIIAVESSLYRVKTDDTQTKKDLAVVLFTSHSRSPSSENKTTVLELEESIKCCATCV